MKKLILLGIVAMAVSPAFADDTIYDIQSGVIPSGSPVNVEDVIVTAGPYEYTASGAYCFVEEPAGGAYSGVEVYWGSAQAAIYGGLMRGDRVNVTGIAAEYIDMTEIDISAPGDTLILVGTGASITPDLVPLDDMMSEPWEAVLVVTYCCVCIEEPDPYGEWLVEDAFGIGRCDDKGLNLTYLAVVGDWRIITGTVWDSYGAYKVCPRDDADVFDPGGPSASEPSTWGGIKALYR